MSQAITMDDVRKNKDNAMVDEKNRLASFKKWPFKKGKCTKEMMAQAGFYKCNIKGEVDSARCFVCFKTLDGWEENDEPFEEHLNHSPNCSFAKLKRSQKDLNLSEWIIILNNRNMNLQSLRLNNKIEDLGNKLQHLKAI